MTSGNYINKIFVIIHFVLYLFCEIPLQCSANGILGTLPRSSNSKESTNVLFGQTSENNNDEQHQNVSVIRNSQVKHKTLEYFIYINKKTLSYNINHWYF